MTNELTWLSIILSHWKVFAYLGVNFASFIEFGDIGYCAYIWVLVVDIKT
jgi:hypothetical protein